MLSNFLNPPSQRSWIHEAISIDIRSLAVLRIGLAMLSLYWLVTLMPSARLFLSDEGVLHVDESIQLLNGIPSGYWSLFWINGSYSFGQALMGLHVIAAFSLLMGFQSRWMLLVCLVLGWSLEVRNPMLQDAGIVLHRMLMFWCLFLPIGEVWSVDRRLARYNRHTSSRHRRESRKRNWTVASFASLGLICQILWIPVISAIGIASGQWSLESWFGSESRVLPGREMWASLLLSAQPLVERTIVIVMLVLVPAILIPPVNQFFRGIWCALFLLVHFILGLTLALGVYPVVAMLSLVVFVPASFWNGVLTEPLDFFARQRPRKQMLIPIGGALLFGFVTLNQLIYSNLFPAPDSMQIVRKLSRLTMTEPGFQYGRQSGEPDHVRIRYLGELQDSRTIDLLTVRMTEWEALRRSPLELVPNDFWRKTHRGMWQLRDQPAILHPVATRLLERVVADWQARNEDRTNRLQNARLILISEKPGGVRDVTRWAEIDL